MAAISSCFDKAIDMSRIGRTVRDAVTASHGLEGSERKRCREDNVVSCCLESAVMGYKEASRIHLTHERQIESKNS